MTEQRIVTRNIGHSTWQGYEDEMPELVRLWSDRMMAHFAASYQEAAKLAGMNPFFGPQVEKMIQSCIPASAQSALDRKLREAEERGYQRGLTEARTPPEE